MGLRFGAGTLRVGGRSRGGILPGEGGEIKHTWAPRQSRGALCYGPDFGRRLWGPTLPLDFEPVPHPAQRRPDPRQGRSPDQQLLLPIQ